MNLREQREKLEKEILSPYAALACESKGRAREENKDDIRTDFARDRDRILHCKSFRRLKQKTQVFLSPQGDHYRTRMTHTLEVTQIARTISRALMLNEDLTEAIGLGHDIGHTPYGHAGERALDALCPGGFKHYLQSVRVCEKLEKDRKGLNLTFETLNGMACHTEGTMPVTLEGQVVRYADRIAFLNHDFEDSVSAGAVTESMLPDIVHERLGDSKSKRITTLIRSIIDNYHDGILAMDDATEEAFMVFNDFMYDTIYLNTEGKPKEEEHKVYGIVESLYDYFHRNPDSMPAFYVETAFSEGVDRAVTDYISGMSDDYATGKFEDLFIPKSWPVHFT